MLMPNLDNLILWGETLCQTTWPQIISTNILNRVGKEENVTITRIPIIPTRLPFQFKSLNFPLKLIL